VESILEVAPADVSIIMEETIEEAVAEAAPIQREQTMHLASLLYVEAEVEISGGEKAHKRRVMSTPIKQSILAKQTEIVKEKPATVASAEHGVEE
jgi:hypothetical protein